MRKRCGECMGPMPRGCGHTSWCDACRKKASRIDAAERARVEKATAEFDAFSARVRAEAGL